MDLQITASKEDLGLQSAKQAAGLIQKTLQQKGHANIILATGASQFGTLNHLSNAEGIDWRNVTMFHLDEYIGLPESHPASFRKYLNERFVQKVEGLHDTHFVQGDREDPQAECDRLGALIQKHPIDVALVGIGENGHLAFNDPPADFETSDPYLVVELDTVCRKQQMGEGWFKSLDEVPRQAISMSVQQIMKSKNIICSVPDKRKAEAVRNCVDGEISNLHPASILQNHDHCTLWLDPESASLLNNG
ncbi:MAG: glucosamine-6-phosphate deaminase [Balneolaceae bacterium]